MPSRMVLEVRNSGIPFFFEIFDGITMNLGVLSINSLDHMRWDRTTLPLLLSSTVDLELGPPAEPENQFVEVRWFSTHFGVMEVIEVRGERVPGIARDLLWATCSFGITVHDVARPFLTAICVLRAAASIPGE